MEKRICNILICLIFTTSYILCESDDKNLDDMLTYMDTMSNQKRLNLFEQITLEATTAIFSEAVLANLQAFRYVMNNSNPSLGIPSLDPWTAPDIEFGVISEEGNINGTVDNIIISNLSTYNVNEWHTEIMRGTFSFSFDEVTAVANYSIDADTSNILKVTSKDQIQIKIHGLNVTNGSFQFKLDNGNLVMKNLTFDLDYDRLKIDFTNLNRKTIVGKAMQEAVDYFVTHIISEQKDEMVEALADNMVDSMNNIFKRRSLQQLFSMFRNMQVPVQKGDTLYDKEVTRSP